MQQQLRNIRAVDTAYLVRKMVEGVPQPFYVLGVVPAYDDSELVNQLSNLDFSGSLVFVLIGGKYKFLQPMLATVVGAKVFPAE